MEREEVEREEGETETEERREGIQREEEEIEGVQREETDREEVDEEENSWDTPSEIERETRRLARWRTVEGFGERRREEEEEPTEADWMCCGRRVISRGGRGGRGRDRGSGADVGLEALQRARHDILMDIRRTL